MLGKLNFNLLTLYIALCKYGCNCQVLFLFFWSVLFPGHRIAVHIRKHTFCTDIYTLFKRVVCKIYSFFLMSKGGGSAVSYFSQNWGGVSTSQLHLKSLKI